MVFPKNLWFHWVFLDISTLGWWSHLTYLWEGLGRSHQASMHVKRFWRRWKWNTSNTQLVLVLDVRPKNGGRDEGCDGSEGLVGNVSIQKWDLTNENMAFQQPWGHMRQNMCWEVLLIVRNHGFSSGIPHGSTKILIICYLNGSLN